MSQEAVVLVQFVGGPIHAECRWMKEAQGLFEHHLPTGHVAVYGLRAAPMGVDWGARLYAPVGMSESVYLDQFATLPRPVSNGSLD
jgi:hypothetical protein